MERECNDSEREKVEALGIFPLDLVYQLNRISHTDNALELCGLLTPLHIVPEWYFLCQYAMLKAVNSYGTLPSLSFLSSSLSLCYYDLFPIFKKFFLLDSYFITWEQASLRSD